MESIKKEYRNDINGLRAIAVLIVLVFHIKSEWMPGGFLGVDVFLVISGYLISKSILFDLNGNNFTLRKFYTKRIKRLFPALAFTLLLSLGVGIFFLTPYFLTRLAKSAISAVMSFSNIFFFFEDGYFDLNSEQKPLLHTWSLGLEEQFYLFWPVLIVMLHSTARKLLWPAIGIVCMISLLLCCTFNSSHLSACFYFLPFRIFEFALGALCITIEDKAQMRSNYPSIFSTLLGISIIMGSALIYNEYTIMPGAISLIPCGGAMLIIISKPNRCSKILLDNPIARLIGKSSYSIYLLHWPIIVYYTLFLSRELISLDYALIFFSSICLGMLCWRFIESIFKKSWFNNKRLWTSTIFICFIIIMIAALIIQFEGFPNNVSNPYVMTPDDIIEERNRYWQESGKKKYNSLDYNKRNILVIGNSHAIDLIYALTYNRIQSNIYFQPSTDRCSNFGAIANVKNAKEIDHCRKIKSDILNWREWAQIEAVYLHDNWINLNLDNLEIFLKELRRKTTAPVYIFGPKMIYREFPLYIIKKSKSYDPIEINHFAEKFIHPRCEQINAKLLRWHEQSDLSNNNIYFIDLLEIHKPYPLVSEATSELYYFDGGHLSEAGAINLGQKLKRKHNFLFQ